VVGIFDAAKYWLKLGCVSFGGPAGQIALMQTDLVDKKAWISQARFNHALNYCMVLPGPEAQQLATYLGWLMHGWRGGLIAGLCFILPSLLLMITLAMLYQHFAGAKGLALLLQTLQPTVFAIIVYAAWRMARRSLKRPFLSSLSMLALAVSLVWQLPFPYLVLAAAVLGYAVQTWLPQWLPSPDVRSVESNEHVTHASNLWCTALLALALWALPMGLLAWKFGSEHRLFVMAWFFTKAALVSFGGAYAVLPYLYQGAVAQFAWLSSQQMLDALALGETTPGPLIMIVAFVGYLACTQNLPGAVSGQFWLGAMGALLACWFTFLPSFVFILIGAPFVERTRTIPKLQGILSAIGAVVVAAIALLAMRLITPTFIVEGHLSWLAIAIAISAALALIKFQRTVIEIVLVSVGIGLLRALLQR
jgi:chromate transporter